MAPTIANIVIDTPDALTLASWWAALLDGRVVQENGGWFVVVGLPGGLSLAFQKVEDPTPGKNRIHVDLVTEDDLDAEVGRIVEAGASPVAQHELDGFRWVTLADPHGNQFCVSGTHA